MKQKESRRSLSKGNLNILLPNKSSHFVPNITETVSTKAATNISHSIPSFLNSTTTTNKGILKNKLPALNGNSLSDIQDISSSTTTKKELSTVLKDDTIIAKSRVIGSTSVDSQFKPRKSGAGMGALKPLATDSSVPQRKTIMNDFDFETLGKQEAKSLFSLYPHSTRNLVDTDIDKEAKKLEYTVANIRATDSYSIALCEFLEIMFRKTLTVTENVKMRKLLNLPDVDYSQFWECFFSDGKCYSFERLMKNYLIKIKVHPVEEVNSGYQSGVLVNMILSRCHSHPYLSKYAKSLCEISRADFQFLCKAIIHSHAWINRNDTKVYLQTLKVKEPLGSGRILLVETLKLIIKNDYINSYSIIHEINDTCWHTLIIWFFEKKNNSIYQQIFFELIQIVLLHTNEKLILTLLLKLNILSNMYKTWFDICQNSVFIKDQHIESMLYHLKKLVKAIDYTCINKEQYTTLRSQLNVNRSWLELKDKLLPKEIKKKKTIVPGSKNASRGRGGNLLTVSNKNPALTSGDRSPVSATKLIRIPSQSSMTEESHTPRKFHN
jgi:hypothetical protein